MTTKTYPEGSTLIVVAVSDLYSRLDVMASAGKNDEVKIDALKQAFEKGRCITKETLSRYALTPIKEGGERRLSLSLPDGYSYPPAVGIIPSLGPGYEVEDGRSWRHTLRAVKETHAVVVFTPHTTEPEVIKEGSRGNILPGGIPRSHQRKDDIKKAVHRLYHLNNMSGVEIKEFLGPIYVAQAKVFNQVLAEVQTNDRTERLASAVTLFNLGGKDPAEVLTLVNTNSKRMNVTLAALNAAIEDKKRLRTKREAFSKTQGKHITAGVDNVRRKLKLLHPKLGKKIESGAIEYEDVQEGLLQFLNLSKTLVQEVEELRESLKNDYGKMYSAAAGR